MSYLLSVSSKCVFSTDTTSFILLVFLKIPVIILVVVMDKK